MMHSMKNVDVLHAAHEYRDYGFSCIPLVGKKPAVAWKEFQSRFPTHGEILTWFGVIQQAARNIGIVTGSISGVVAVDVDSRETARWAWDNLPRTDAMTRTGDGRGHLYYQLPSGMTLRNRVRIKGRAIDLRAEGGYCVAAPSIHPDSGRTYEKVGGWRLSHVPEFPMDWIETGPVHISEPIGRIMNRIQRQERRIRDLMAYCLPIPSIQGDNGSKGCFRVACLCREHGLSPEQAFVFLQEWQATSPRVQPKWSNEELLHKIAGAYADERSE